MIKIASHYILIIFTVCVVLFSVDFILIEDNFMQSSISDIIDSTHNFDLNEHILILGLTPFYIAFVIFGSSIFGIYLGLFLRHLFFAQKKQPSLNGRMSIPQISKLRN